MIRSGYKVEKIILVSKRILKHLLKVSLAISLVLFLLWLPLWYLAKPVNNFCDSFTNDSSYENVILKAKELKYRVFDNVKEKYGTLSVETQDSPFFRMACFITFKDNKITKQEVRNSD